MTATHFGHALSCAAPATARPPANAACYADSARHIQCRRRANTPSKPPSPPRSSSCQSGSTETRHSRGVDIVAHCLERYRRHRHASPALRRSANIFGIGSGEPTRIYGYARPNGVRTSSRGLTRHPQERPHGRPSPALPDERDTFRSNCPAKSIVASRACRVRPRRRNGRTAGALHGYWRLRSGPRPSCRRSTRHGRWFCVPDNRARLSPG